MNYDQWNKYNEVQALQDIDEKEVGDNIIKPVLKVAKYQLEIDKISLEKVKNVASAVKSKVCFQLLIITLFELNIFMSTCI